MHDRLDCLEHLLLEEHLLEAEAVERVLLHDAHDLRRKVLADVAEPARHGGRRSREVAASLGVVERLEGAVHRKLASLEAETDRLLRLCTEREPPPAKPFG